VTGLAPISSDNEPDELTITPHPFPSKQLSLPFKNFFLYTPQNEWKVLKGVAQEISKN
jgi:hypothetical protein